METSHGRDAAGRALSALRPAEKPRPPDPRVTLERALSTEVVAAIDRLIEQRTEEIAARQPTPEPFAAGTPWLTVAEAAKALGCSEVAVRARHKRGRLTGKYQGSRLYIASQSVLELGPVSADAGSTKPTKVAPATLDRRRGRTPKG